MHLDIDTERKKDDKDRPTHRLRQPRADSIPSVRPSVHPASGCVSSSPPLLGRRPRRPSVRVRCVRRHCAPETRGSDTRHVKRSAAAAESGGAAALIIPASFLFPVLFAPYAPQSIPSARRESEERKRKRKPELRRN